MSRVRYIQDAGFEIVRRLREHGHIALWAGGCVRDMLMGHEPADVDIATDAPPDRVCELFSKTHRVGAAFGVVLVRQGRYWVETATFRTDLSYKDGRRPEGVVFSTPEEDAKRRDFTINGLFYDPIDQRVIDYVGGEADIQAKIIRAIGEPDRRFAEDHLRLLRAVRFATRFEFDIEPATAAAIRGHATELPRISAERIREELSKMLSRPGRARAIQLIAEMGLLPYLWSGADQDLSGGVLDLRSMPAPGIVAAIRPEEFRALEETGDQQSSREPGTKCVDDGLKRAVSRLAALPAGADFVVSMAALLLETSRERTEEVGRALRCSNEQIDSMGFLMENEPRLDWASNLTLAQFKRLMANKRWDDLLELHRAKLVAKNGSMESYETALARAGEMPPEKIAPAPFVVGEDLIELGLQPGPQFKSILDHLYDLQLNEKLADRETALQLLKRMADSA